MFYEEEVVHEKDEVDEMVDSYLRTAKTTELSALKFWKQYESAFPYLAILARKFLSVPAAVERKGCSQ